MFGVIVVLEPGAEERPETITEIRAEAEALGGVTAVGGATFGRYVTAWIPPAGLGCFLTSVRGVAGVEMAYEKPYEEPACP